MTKKVIITGEAEFISSHLVDKLIEEKQFDVSRFDALEELVHGKINNPPKII